MIGLRNITAQANFSANELTYLQDLKSSVLCGDLNGLERVVACRDARGVPLVNLNHQYENNCTALMFALIASPINEQIVGCLLDVRDYAGNVIVDLNQLGPFGRGVFSFILNNQDAGLRRRLLQRVLDVRGPQGELVANPQADACNITILKQVIDKNDIHCLRILLDIRLENGYRALDVNQITHQSTVLDAALRRDSYSYRYDQEIVEVLRDAGARCYRDLVQEQIVERAPVRQLVPLINNNRRVEARMNDPLADRFNQNQQNTHDPSVTQTVKGSIDSLKLVYDLPSAQEEDTVFIKIKNIIDDFDYGTLVIDKSLSIRGKKKAAVDCLELIKSRKTELHSYTNLKICQILYLIWRGVTDDSLLVYPDEIKRLLGQNLTRAPGYLIEMKKSSLVEKFIEASFTYEGYVDICVGGLIHKLVEILNHAHSSVMLCTGSSGINEMANQVPASVAKRILEGKPIREQRVILNSWGNEGSAPDAFIQILNLQVEEQLNRQFGTLLTVDLKSNILNALAYLSKPVLHVQLEELVNIISEISNEEPEPFITIKNHAKRAYDQNDRSFQDEFNLLHGFFIDFLGQIPPRKLTEKFASQVKYINNAEKIAACPNHLVIYFSAEQVPHIIAEQVPYLAKDRLRCLVNSAFICSVSKWDFVYLNKNQLKLRNDIRVYVAFFSILSVPLGLVSLFAWALFPIISIFSKSRSEKIRELVHLNLKRLFHLFNEVIPLLTQTA